MITWDIYKVELLGAEQLHREVEILRDVKPRNISLGLNLEVTPYFEKKKKGKRICGIPLRKCWKKKKPVPECIPTHFDSGFT